MLRDRSCSDLNSLLDSLPVSDPPGSLWVSQKLGHLSVCLGGMGDYNCWVIDKRTAKVSWKPISRLQDGWEAMRRLA